MDLQKGSIGFLVRETQADLTLIGYPITVNGVFDQATEAAIKAFQAAQGITVDGIFGPITEGKMEAAITAIRQAMRDESNHKVIGVISGQVVNGGFYFNLPVKNASGEMVDVLWLRDTGCSPDMLVTAGTAAQLGLPNMGVEDVSGVGGAQSAHKTQVVFDLGGHEFTVPAIVDESTSFGINLFGAGLPLNDQMTESIDWHAKTFTLKAFVVPQAGQAPPDASYTPPQEG